MRSVISVALSQRRRIESNQRGKIAVRVTQACLNTQRQGNAQSLSDNGSKRSRQEVTAEGASELVRTQRWMGSLPGATGTRPQPANARIGLGASPDPTVAHPALQATWIARPLHCIHHGIQAGTDQFGEMLAPHVSCSHVASPALVTNDLPPHNAVV